MLVFWACYWAGTTVHAAFFYAGILTVGTLLLAVTCGARTLAPR